MAALASAGRDYGEPNVFLDPTAVSLTHFVQPKKNQIEISSQVSEVLITCAQNSQLSQLLTASHTPTEPDPPSAHGLALSSLHSVLEGKQLKGNQRGDCRVFKV